MNDERRRAVEVALQRMINQHPHITLPELIAVGIENALSWPQMEIPAVPDVVRHPSGTLSLRGRWGCGCRMEDCDIRWGRVRGPFKENSRIEVHCLTHDLTGSSDPTPDYAGASEDHLQRQAVSQLNLAHEEQCR